ncbi:MAG TPA: M15 family metallopeptidase [Mesotoga prima]|uniref:M15 family metallopeptidase n=1 Tax=Mesotoga prima TaxID=1184387 RepID=UPI002BD2CBD9|nr:M15 family metallopeptidase [Mesotoga prima]HPE52962.1 M15 family metallopeptidase [Mesotoga prima]
MVQFGVESENGWRPAKASADQCVWVKVPGTTVSLQILRGQPEKILRAFAADFNAYVEPLRDPDSASWTPTNSVATSNHLNGTAMDLNWQSHPFRVLNAGFNQSQINTINDLLDFYENTIFWGNYWSNPKDAMHFQMGYGTWNNPKTQDFINRKIRPDGYSTFRRGGTFTPAPAQVTYGEKVEILAEAMGNSIPMDRYRDLLPAVSEALAACDCTTVPRIAMWMAQIGHESAGLKYMEEIASGEAYEGRSDLGNHKPGDGKRYKGRGPIQITGRHNYTKVSEWAFKNGYTTYKNFFVEHPEKLSDSEYGFLGVVWYWTVARPHINQLCDNGDLSGVTQAINGGYNGLEDRRNRWNKAKGMGDKLLSLVGKSEETQEDGFMSALSADEQRALYNAIMMPRPSKSPLAHIGEGNIGNSQDIEGYMDANIHVLVVDLLARLGDPNTLALLEEVSNVDLAKYPNKAGGKNLALAILENARRLASGGSAPAPSGSAPAPPVQTRIEYVPVPAPPAPAATAAPLPVTGDGLYNEINNFKNLLQEVGASISQAVKGE